MTIKDQAEGFDFLAEVKGYSAYVLASEYAGCGSPNSRESLGAQMLTELRDEIVAAWEGGKVFDLDCDRDDIDHALKLADETLSDYSHQVMVQFVEVCAYHEQSPFTADGTWGPGTFEDMARQALGEVLTRMATALVREIRTAWEGLECSDCSGAWADCRDGCVQDPEAAAEAFPEPPTHLADPLYQLLADKPSETQAFMANMAQINADEFAAAAKRRQRIKAGLGVLAVVASGALVLGLAWIILGGM